jgi:hypothetical protein
MHDVRVGRFWSVDPLAMQYPWNSPYSFAENKVIQFVELEGGEIALPRIFGPLIRPTLTIPRAPTIPTPPTMPLPPIVIPQPLEPLNPAYPSAPTVPATPNISYDMSQGEVDWDNPPASPEGLGEQWKEVTDPRNTSGSRDFENKETGDRIRFDKGDPNKSGWKGKDHWHRLNPRGGKGQEYLDRHGNPVGRDSEKSHIPAGGQMNTLPEVIIKPSTQMEWKQY